MSIRKKIRQAMECQRRGELEKAKLIYREVLDVKPFNPDALHLYGLVCHQQGDHETAVRYIAQAVDRAPNQPVLRNNLGDALRRVGNFEEATRQLHRALRLRPDYAGAHLNLGSVYFDTGNHEAALHHAAEAVHLAPDRGEGWFNLGLVLLDHVRLYEAVDAFRKAIQINPGYQAAASAMLYTLNLSPGTDPEFVSAEHRKVAGNLFRTGTPETMRAVLERPVRIGYLSGDFRAHAVNYFFEPILEHHDASRFEVFCYSDTEHADEVTLRLKRLAHHWRETAGLADEDVLRLIRADDISVLVDLAGHTKRNRLGVFARRAAPCQVSYLGYPATTGLESMDYRIVDAVTAPPAEKVGGMEALLRLDDGFACFRPPDHAPQVVPPPVSRRGYITFGAFHKLEKVNREVIETWAQVLHRVPGSRLLLARDNLDAWQQGRLASLFRERGIAADRLQMKHLHRTGASFLELFAGIDIQLDTFPWSGHTMACMSLWMGVPVVTLSGNSHVGRMVASVLTSISLEDLVAHDRESYVRDCSELAANPVRLENLRHGLRERMEKSPLLDESNFTRMYERAILGAVNRSYEST